jgi:hypothetical protein
LEHGQRIAVQREGLDRTACYVRYY